MWVTRKQNERHKFSAGTKVLGTKNHNAKFTADEIAHIRTSREPQFELAKKFNVNRNTISKIVRRKSYMDD